MAYSHVNEKGVTYYLAKKDVVLKGGKHQVIYFFTKTEDGGKGTPCDLPENMEVNENPRNGFLTLKKKA
ncbi:MAG: hypothetical protein Q4F60_02890 [Candidatus Saccharibacteria bacterium]|nr:hypothetical protein [Candidatus Saccharibacteria bacterium]